MCPHMAKGVREFSRVTFTKTRIPFMKVPIISQGPSPRNTITLVIRSQHIYLGATQIVYSTISLCQHPIDSTYGQFVMKNNLTTVNEVHKIPPVYEENP